MTTALIIAALLWLVVGLYLGQGYRAWTGALILGITASIAHQGTLTAGPLVAAGIGATVAALFGVPAIRRAVVSAPALLLVRRILPTMGETERIALEAGTVGWDGELI